MITFPKAGNVREVIPILPLSRCLVETDTPYLAPIPHRGKPNRPAYVVEIAERLAKETGRPSIRSVGFMLSSCCDGPPAPSAILDLNSMLWSPTGTGKLDIHDEESWVMLWDDTLLTIDCNNVADLTAAESFDPKTGIVVAGRSHAGSDLRHRSRRPGLARDRRERAAR